MRRPWPAWDSERVTSILIVRTHHLYILHILMRDEILSCLSVVSYIGHYSLAEFQCPVFDHTSSWRRITRERVGPVLDGEISQANLIRVAVHDGGHAEVARVDGVVADLQLEVASVVHLGPLKLAVVFGQVVAGVIGFRETDILSVRTGARDGSACKFDSNASFA